MQEIPKETGVVFASGEFSCALTRVKQNEGGLFRRKGRVVIGR